MGLHSKPKKIQKKTLFGSQQDAPMITSCSSNKTFDPFTCRSLCKQSHKHTCRLTDRHLALLRTGHIGTSQDRSGQVRTNQ